MTSPDARYAPDPTSEERVPQSCRAAPVPVIAARRVANASPETCAGETSDALLDSAGVLARKVAEASYLEGRLAPCFQSVHPAP